MKKILSAILVATMFIACFGLTANATLAGEVADDEAGTVEFVISDSCVDGAFTLTYTLTFKPLIKMTNGDTMLQMSTYYDTSLLTHDLDKTIASSTVVLDGESIDGCFAEEDLVIQSFPDESLVYIVFTDIGSGVSVGSTLVVTFNLCFDVIATEEATATFNHDGLYGFAGYANPEFYEDYTATVAPAAPEYTKPATPAAQTKAACEACGTDAGVRFLMTVDKTAADYADVTAYGVVIAAGGKEYKYTVDAGTKKAETDTKIEYAVVVTGAPAGTTFTATAFLMYGDTEVAGVSGELTA